MEPATVDMPQVITVNSSERDNRWQVRAYHQGRLYHAEKYAGGSRGSERTADTHGSSQYAPKPRISSGRMRQYQNRATSTLKTRICGSTRNANMYSAPCAINLEGLRPAAQVPEDEAGPGEVARSIA